VTTFFHAWRRRQAEQQAAEWEEEKEAARSAVLEVPPWIRSDVRRVIETLIDGADSEVKNAVEELHKLLETDPKLHDRFFQLRVVDDAVEFLK
jgi:predicted nucleic acid-binding Zn ribbon protein